MAQSGFQPTGEPTGFQPVVVQFFSGYLCPPGSNSTQGIQAAGGGIVVSAGKSGTFGLTTE